MQSYFGVWNCPFSPQSGEGLHFKFLFLFSYSSLLLWQWCEKLPGTRNSHQEPLRGPWNSFDHSACTFSCSFRLAGWSFSGQGWASTTWTHVQQFLVLMKAAEPVLGPGPTVEMKWFVMNSCSIAAANQGVVGVVVLLYYWIFPGNQLQLNSNI